MSTTVADSRILSLSSNSAVLLNGTLNSNVTFNIFNFHIRTKDTAYITMRLRNATIPHFFYNIVQGSIVFQYNSLSTAPPATITVPVLDGIYNIYSLVKALNFQLSLATADGTSLSNMLRFDYDSVTNRVNLYVTASPIGAVLPVLKMMPSTLASQLGFTVYPTGSEMFFSNAYQAGMGPNLIAVSCILIQAQEIRTENYSSELNSTILGKIPLSGASESVSTYNFTDDKAFLVPPSALQNQLTLYFYDQNGNLINFRGYHWYLTIELTFYRTGISPMAGLYDTLNSVVTELQQEMDALQQQQQDAQQDQGQEPLQIQSNVPQVPMRLTAEELQQLTFQEMPESIRNIWQDIAPDVAFTLSSPETQNVESAGSILPN
jgi:hypothetical protein